MKTASHNAGCSSNLIYFGEKMAHSPQLERLYQDGMALLEETAEYLGPDIAKGTGKQKRSTQQMKASTFLTARLIRIAAWLLLQRAVARGEISLRAAVNAPHRVPLEGLASNQRRNLEQDNLPPKFRELSYRTSRMLEHLKFIDRMFQNLPANMAGRMPAGRLTQSQRS